MEDQPTRRSRGEEATDRLTGEEILGLFDALHAAGNTLVLVTHEREVARLDPIEALRHE